MKFKELKQDIKLQEFRQNNSKLPRIYCDMDGVLCNFEQLLKKSSWYAFITMGKRT